MIGDAEQAIQVDGPQNGDPGYSPQLRKHYKNNGYFVLSSPELHKH